MLVVAVNKRSSEEMSQTAALRELLERRFFNQSETHDARLQRRFQ